MKKYMVLCAAACVALAFTSCKSQESAYKKAYEKAKAQESTQAVAEQQPAEQSSVSVTPMVEKPATETKVVDNYDNVQVRPESVTMVNGAGIKAFSVVVGSFGVKANAEGLQGTLKGQGYEAQIVFNSERNMYRVISATFDDKTSAARSRDEFRAKYPDAWLLYKK
jgi:cell division protein FtsN